MGLMLRHGHCRHRTPFLCHCRPRAEEGQPKKQEGTPYLLRDTFSEPFQFKQICYFRILQHFTMSDDSDCPTTEIDDEVVPTEIGTDDEDAIDSTGAYIDRCESVTMLDISRMVSASGGRIKVAILGDQELNCWNILQHCMGQVDAVRQAYGGKVSCFKIGVTAAPNYRFQYYVRENFHSMTLIHVSDSADVVNMLEAALIQLHMHIRGCRNINLGGEGAMSRNPPLLHIYRRGAG